MFSTLRARQPGAPLWRVLFYRCCLLSARAALHVGFGLRVTGSERVPPTGPLLLAANHQSYLDPPAISTSVLHRHTTFIARAGLFKVKPFAWLISTLSAIPLREDSGDAAAIRATIGALEQGQMVLIFPEGSRTETGQIGEFKRGVALLVKKARCPVVPAAIAGAFEAWPRSRKFPRLFGKPVRVAFGEPIPYDALMKDGPDAALALIRARVVALHASLTASAAANAGSAAARS